MYIFTAEITLLFLPGLMPTHQQITTTVKQPFNKNTVKTQRLFWLHCRFLGPKLNKKKKT